MLKLYENIKQIRKEKGMSQAELAKKVGYTDRSSIAKIESGAVDLQHEKICKFADALGVTPAFLMGWEEQIDYIIAMPNGKEVLFEIEKMRLTEENLNALLQYAQFLKQKEVEE